MAEELRRLSARCAFPVYALTAANKLHAISDAQHRWNGCGGSQYTSEKLQRLMADNGVTCSMSRSGNGWDNAAMESFFSSMETERVGRKTYRTRNHAKAEVFDYIERFYNPTRRHSMLGGGYLSPRTSSDKRR